ncbi:MAG: hypothetical protein D6675_15155 [Gemmatimonadetes bacterium]|nr:MAG: hypothetical protein D6675_15155 [Gemmatimonadota bacterium]
MTLSLPELATLLLSVQLIFSVGLLILLILLIVIILLVYLRPVQEDEDENIKPVPSPKSSPKTAGDDNPERKKFKDDWASAIQDTVQVQIEFRDALNEITNVTKSAYESQMRWGRIKKVLRKFCHLYLFDWLTPAEKAYLNHPAIKKYVYRCWAESVRISQQGYRALPKETFSFLEYVYKFYRINHDGSNSELFKKYYDLGLSLKMLRPNNQAHVYVSFAFENRPLKPYISEYLRLAIVTGEYDLILKRFKPYHSMLNIAPVPGERTVFDSRFDFLPMLIPLDLKYSFPIELYNIQTRRRNRYISLPAVRNAKLELRKKGELNTIEKQTSFFPHSYLKEVTFAEDGEVYHVNGTSKTKIENYGHKRNAFLQKKYYQKLYQGIPPIDPTSAVTVHFNLREPVAVLFDGIHKERELELNKVIRVIKCLDLYIQDYQAGQRRPIEQFIADMYPFDSHPLTPKTAEFIHQIEEIQREQPYEILEYTLDQLQKKNVAKDIIEVLKTKKDEINHKKCKTKAVFESVLDEVLAGKQLSQIDKDLILKYAAPSEDDAWHFLIQRCMEGYAPRFILPTLVQQQSNAAFDVVFSLFPLLTGKELTLDPKEASNLDIEELFEDKTLHLIESAQKILEELVLEVLTKHIEISAATAKARSEAQLVEMVLEACLKVEYHHRKREEDFQLLRQNLLDHLQRHYTMHHQFLKEIYQHLGDKDILSDINKLNMTDDEFKEFINNEVDAIITLIHRAQGRVFDRGISNRLLLFIEPKSVEVITGHFEYHGLEKEQKYLNTKIEHELDIVQTQLETELREIKARLAAKASIAEVTYSIGVMAAKTEQLVAEIALQLREAQRDGDITQYIKLFALYEIQKNGFTELERILQTTPEILLGVNDPAYTTLYTLKLKFELINLLKTNPDIDALTIAAILEANYSTLINTEVYRDHNQLLADTLKNTYFVQHPDGHS